MIRITHQNERGTLQLREWLDPHRHRTWNVYKRRFWWGWKALHYDTNQQNECEKLIEFYELREIKPQDATAQSGGD